MDPTATLAGLLEFNVTDGQVAGNVTHQLATLATSVLATGLQHYQVVSQNATHDTLWANSSLLLYPPSSASSSSEEFFASRENVSAVATLTATAAALLPGIASNLTANTTNGQPRLATTITSKVLAAVVAAAAAAPSSSSSEEDDWAAVSTIGPSAGHPSNSSSGGGASLANDNPISTLSKIIIGILCLAIILGTVIGNILVCIAVCLVKKLRRPCNYLLVSLALSDLCVAVLVMPVALLNELGEEWPFGTLFCDIWVSFDVLSCTASILNLCAISVDRYWAITKPLEYGVKRTPRRMLMCVALVWLGAACISLPPLLILGNEHQMPETNAPWCQVCQSFGYQIYATFCAFYLPLIIMLFVYYQIFRAARRIVLDEKRAQTRLDQAMMINGHTQAKDLKVPTNGSGTGSTALMAGGATGSPHHQQKRLRFQLAKERKASTTLGIIMSSFTLCWLPFFILAILRPFLDADHMVPDFLSSIFLWLGYTNSLLNPIIYATLNRDFRKPFQEILFFRCSNLNTIMREEYYHSQYGEPASQRVVVGGEGHGARESFL